MEQALPSESYVLPLCDQELAPSRLQKDCRTHAITRMIRATPLGDNVQERHDGQYVEDERPRAILGVISRWKR